MFGYKDSTNKPMVKLVIIKVINSDALWAVEMMVTVSDDAPGSTKNKQTTKLKYKKKATYPRLRTGSRTELSAAGGKVDIHEPVAFA